ncbi:MAG TPA: hypothetical protein VMH28_13840 [Candidatus Acidoferrales bacterium]|nr:hypothetical protein [Candidatus Acidoferrales bacterium]
MSTLAQIAANQANAQKSTGPRTPEGKEASRFNALKHGLDAASVVIPGEDAAAYDALAARYQAELRPQTSVEQFHLDTLIRSDWQRRRLQRTEAKLYRALLAEGASPEDLDVAILRDSPTAKLLRRVFSQIASLDRAYHRAFSELRRIHLERVAYQRELAQYRRATEIRSSPSDLGSFQETPAPRAESAAPGSSAPSAISVPGLT